MIKCKLDYSKVPSSIYIVYKLQGTASVVLAGLIVAQKLLGGILAEHTFLRHCRLRQGHSCRRIQIHPWFPRLQR